VRELTAAVVSRETIGTGSGASLRTTDIGALDR